MQSLSPPRILLSLILTIPVALNVLSVYTCDAAHKLNAVLTVPCMGSKYYFVIIIIITTISNDATLRLL